MMWKRIQCAVLACLMCMAFAAAAAAKGTDDAPKTMERPKATECGKTKVIFVIITDGLENASTKFTKQKVKEMISDKQEQDGWDFIYLGANIDAAEEAGAIGVKKANAVTYRNTKSGVRANYDAVNTYVEETAEGGGTIPAKWRAHVEEDTSK